MDQSVIQQIIDEQLNPIEDAKKRNAADLQEKVDAFKNVGGNSSYQMALWLMSVMYAGSYSQDTDAALPHGSDSGATFIGNQEDKIREVGAQKAVTNAYTSVLSDAQGQFNDEAGGDLSKISSDLKEMKDCLGNMSSGSPFDDASKKAISDACDKLQGYLDQIGPGKTWTSLQDLYDKAGSAGDTTGASGMLKDFSDQFSTISTTTQTVSNTLSTNMQMVNADYQQYLGIYNSLMQALLQGCSDSVKAQVV